MSEKSIEEKVKEIIVEQLGVNPEQVTPNASFIETSALTRLIRLNS
jgi:acyl carrier protein